MKKGLELKASNGNSKNMYDYMRGLITDTAGDVPPRRFKAFRMGLGKFFSLESIETK